MAGLTFTKDLAIIPVDGCDRIAKKFMVVIASSAWLLKKVICMLTHATIATQ